MKKQIQVHWHSNMTPGSVQVYPSGTAYQRQADGSLRRVQVAPPSPSEVMKQAEDRAALPGHSPEKGSATINEKNQR